MNDYIRMALDATKVAHSSIKFQYVGLFDLQMFIYEYERLLYREYYLRDIVRGFSYKHIGKKVELFIEYFNTKEEVVEIFIHAEKAIKIAERVADKINRQTNSKYEALKMIHNKIIKKVSYNYDSAGNILLGKSIKKNYASRFYGVFLYNSAICEGISDAVKILADFLHISCKIIIGDVLDENNWYPHSWNLVKINSNVYHLDVTNDMTLYSELGIYDYTYFNLNDKKIQNTHKWDRNMYPISKGSDLNYFVYNNAHIDIKNIIRYIVSKKKDKLITFSYYGDSRQAEEQVNIGLYRIRVRNAVLKHNDRIKTIIIVING